MNIFYLDHNPLLSAQYHCDKHVCKMIVEYAQMLSTAHRIVDGAMYIEYVNGRRIKRWALSEEDYEKMVQAMIKLKDQIKTFNPKEVLH